MDRKTLVDRKTLGKRYKTIREQLLGIEQTQMARELGVSQGTIAQIEKGTMSIEMFWRLLDYYKSKDLNIVYLFIEPFNPNLLLFNNTGVDPDVKEVVMKMKALMDMLLTLLRLPTR